MHMLRLWLIMLQVLYSDLLPDHISPLDAGGHLMMTRFLISKSVWLDSYDAFDETPLHLAARG